MTGSEGFNEAFHNSGPSVSNFQDEITDQTNVYYNESMYQAAIDHEKKLAFELSSLPGTEQLNEIAKGINYCGRITADQAFKIGENLNIGKGICKREGIGYEKWFESCSFGFSYETGNNYILIFKHCFGMRKVALELPVTLLAKISQPSFHCCYRSKV